MLVLYAYAYLYCILFFMYVCDEKLVYIIWNQTCYLVLKF